MTKKEQQRERGRQWYLKNRSLAIARAAMWAAANPDKAKANKRRHYDANRDEAIRRSRQWELDHPEEAKARKHKHKGAKSPEDFLAVLAAEQKLLAS